MVSLINRCSLQTCSYQYKDEGMEMKYRRQNLIRKTLLSVSLRQSGMKSKTNTKWGENATRDNEEMTEVHILERKREDPLNKVSYYQHKPHEHVLI